MITRDRLSGWEYKLNSNDATPQVLVGVSHSGPTKNMPVVVITEDAKISDTILLLEHALSVLKKM